MLVTTAQLFKIAYGRYAVGAYSINTLEQALGLFRGSIEAQAPIIVQISHRARQYAGANVLEATTHAVGDLYPEAVYAVHLDHGSEADCYACIDSGYYTSVMIDASRQSFAENVATTRRVVECAHARGVSVEAELGRVGGKEEDVQVEEKDALLTVAGEAAEFVRLTGCDSLAVAIGTSHGVYKFKAGQPGLRLDRLAEIQRALPGIPLVLHGSSAVLPGEVARINAAGGALDPQAQGVNEDEYAAAVRLGIAKINIDTDSRLVWTRVFREYFRDHPEVYDFREPGQVFVEEYAHLVARKSAKFGCAGRLAEVRAALAVSS
jgi:fructose-bisphosphate aldolase class II